MVISKIFLANRMRQVRLIKPLDGKKIIPDSDLLGPGYYGNDQIPFDFTGNYYMGFYSDAEIAENLFTRHLLKGEIYKIRFKFGHNGNNGKLSFSMLNKFVLEQDYTTSGTNHLKLIGSLFHSFWIKFSRAI